MADDPPYVPCTPAVPPSGEPSHEPLAAQEEAAFSAGLTPEQLKELANGPQIPPLSEDEQKAAASQDNGQAKAEERSLSANRSPEELAAIARNNEADREQRFKDAFEDIAIKALYIGAYAIIVLALTWAALLIIPKEYRWLTPEEISHLQTILTAGVLLGAVSSHFKKRMGEADNDE